MNDKDNQVIKISKPEMVRIVNDSKGDPGYQMGAITEYGRARQEIDDYRELLQFIYDQGDISQYVEQRMDELFKKYPR
jgi:hypothetical protein